MNLRTNGKCTTCSVTTVTHNQWVELPHEQRRELRQLGYNRHGRGTLCHRCATAETKALTPRPDNPTSYTRDELLAEWEHLADPSLPLKTQCELAAPRLGMRADTLERALQRAGITSAYLGGGRVRKAAA